MVANEIRQQITDQIIFALENERRIPWVRPWRPSKNAGHPKNVVSGRSYSGVNPILCDLHAERFGFQSKWWGTFQQWTNLGGTILRRPSNVRPGEWGCRIVFYRPVKKAVVNKDTGEVEKQPYLVMRDYVVFNVDQVQGAKLDKYRVQPDGDNGQVLPNFAPAEELIQTTGALIQHGGNDAYYRRPDPLDSWPNHASGDFIVVPNKSQFNSPQDYYATLFHELGHYAEVRTGWDHRQKGYELGELAAEISSCYLASELGIPQGDLRNHARYVRHWLEAMKGDASYVIKASSQASKVSDYLLSFVRKTEPATEELAEAV